MEMEKISSSLEDYLEAIAEIIEDNGHAHTKDIADKLHVKMPSVTSALQTLSAKGLIRYQSHAPVVLTAAGSERAAVIRLRHAAFNNFFREILKLSPEEANDTACKVEHIVCEKVMSRFVSLTDAIMQRSDCAELRKYLEQTMPQICSDSTEDLVSLETWKKVSVVGHISDVDEKEFTLMAAGGDAGAFGLGSESARTVITMDECRIAEVE